MLPPEPMPGAPQCVTKLGWLKHAKGGAGLRPDLRSADLVAVCEYLVGEGKGPSGDPPTMFSNAPVPHEFATRWMARSRALDADQPGYDVHRKKWPLEQAWCVEVSTANMWPDVAKLPNESRCYRVIISPDPKMWKRVGLKSRDEQADAVRKLTLETITRMENDLQTQFFAVSSVHLNTPQTHSHTVIRGLDRSGKRLFMASKYWRPAIRNHSRQALWEMFVRKDVANVG